MLVEGSGQSPVQTPADVTAGTAGSSSSSSSMDVDGPSCTDTNNASSSSSSLDVAAGELEEDDPDDPVVEVLDVYIRRFDDILNCSSSSSSSGGAAADSAAASSSSGSKVFVLQFPLRPQGRPYGDHGQLQEIAYRQQQQQLRFSYLLHSEGSNFDRNHPLAAAAAAAAAAPGGKPAAAEAATKHVLKSQVAKGSDCCYAVGLVRDGALYITPAQGMLQFKPDFAAFEALQQQQQLSSSKRLQQQGPGGAEPASPNTGTAFSAASAQQQQQQQQQQTAAENNTAGDGTAAVTGQQQRQQQQPQLIQSVGETRTRISHSRQRDIEESEPWLPVETFYDADSPEAFDLLNALVDNVTTKAAGLDDALSGSLFGLEPQQQQQQQEQQQQQQQQEQQQQQQHLDILFSSDITSYLASICQQQEQQEHGGGTAAAAAAAAGPLSYAVLRRLSLEQQVYKIMKQLQLASYATVKRLLATPAEEQQLLQQLLQQCCLVQGNWCLKSSLCCSSTYEATCRDLLLALLIRDAQQQQSSTGIAKEAFRAATRLPVETADALLKQVAVCSSSSWSLKLPADVSFLSAHPKLAAHFSSFWESRLKEVVKEIHAKRDAMENKAKGQEGSSSASPAQLQLASRVIRSLLSDFGGLSAAEIQRKLSENSEELKALTPDELKHVLLATATHVNGIWVLKALGNPQIDECRSSLIKIFSGNKPPNTKDKIIQAIEADLQRRVSLPDFALRKLLREFTRNEGGLWVFKGNKTAEASPAVLNLTA